MKPWLGVSVIILAGVLAGKGFADGKGPEVLNVDHKISVRADAIALGQLLRFWDQATGMKSTVPPELENRKLSVRFTGLAVNDALRRMFDGQPFGYILTGDQVVVTARPTIGSVAVPEAAPGFTKGPVMPDAARMKAQPPEPQPNFIPAPTAPIVNPVETQQPFIELPPVLLGPPSYLAPPLPPIPPSGAANGPAQNMLFGPLPIYRDPSSLVP